MPAQKYEVFVAEYRDYELKVSGYGSEWEYSIGQGKWNVVQRVAIKGSRHAAQQAAAGHLLSFLSKTEQRRYDVDGLGWRDWIQETRDWLAGRRSEKP